MLSYLTLSPPVLSTKEFGNTYTNMGSYNKVYLPITYPTWHVRILSARGYRCTSSSLRVCWPQVRVPSLLGTVKESFALMLNDAVLSELIK